MNNPENAGCGSEVQGGGVETHGAVALDPHAALWDAVYRSRELRNRSDDADEETQAAALSAVTEAERLAVAVVPTTARGALCLLSILEDIDGDDLYGTARAALDKVKAALSGGAVGMPADADADLLAGLSRMVAAHLACGDLAEGIDHPDYEGFRDKVHAEWYAVQDVRPRTASGLYAKWWAWGECFGTTDPNEALDVRGRDIARMVRDMGAAAGAEMAP